MYEIFQKFYRNESLWYYFYYEIFLILGYEV